LDQSPFQKVFQRGELAVEREELPNTHRAKLHLPSWISPFEKGEAVKKLMRSIANTGKSPLTPLFQRGELAVESVRLPSTYKPKIYLAPRILPPLKKGDDRGIWIFSQLRGTKRGI
jgi:hypothetical protein